MDSDVSNGPDFSGILLLAAALSFGAGIIHFIVTPEYLSQWWGYGFFFMLVAIGQITYGLLLFMRPLALEATGDSGSGPDPFGRMLYFSAAYVNLAIVLLYIITRSVGIPLFGPQAGSVEPVTALSLAATLMEAALAVSLYLLAKRTASVTGRASITVRP